jgi:hypothetical protein
MVVGKAMRSITPSVTAPTAVVDIVRDASSRQLKKALLRCT